MLYANRKEYTKEHKRTLQTKRNIERGSDMPDKEYINETLKTINGRCSARKFIPNSVTEQEKQIIEAAGLRAPCGGKMSKYTMIEIRDPELKRKIARNCDNQMFIADAPLVYGVFADFNRWYRLFENNVKTLQVHINYPREDEIMLSAIDAILAAENMVIAAESMGISSCFIADLFIHYEEHKKLFNLPKYVLPLTLIIMGRPVKEFAHKPTPRIGIPVVYRDKYEDPSDEELKDMVVPLIPKDKEGKPTMSVEDYISRYYVRRLGSALSFERALCMRKAFKDWLSNPYDDDAE